MNYAERLGKRASASRGYHSAFITTFALEFAGFEEVMLPQLAAAGATNVVVIADPRMTTLALSDGSILPQQLGRYYVLHGPEQASGVFHPKIVLQIGREGGRVFVGSANATASGIGGNLEIVTEVSCTAESSPERAFVRAAWDYVSSVCAAADGAVRDGLTWALQRAPWLGEAQASAIVTLDDRSRLGFFARPGDQDLADRFAAQIDEPVERLVVLSPYWDDLRALKSLMSRLDSPPTTVLLDVGTHDFPTDAEIPAAIRLVDTSGWHEGRFKHAKFILAQTATHDHLLAGSANCTAAALGGARLPGVNSEASVYRRVPAGAAFTSLGLAVPLAGKVVEAATLPEIPRRPPIALERAREIDPGHFEVEHGELRWTPSREDWAGDIILLDRHGAQIGQVAITAMITHEGRRKARVEGIAEACFARIDSVEAKSSPAPLIHRGILRAGRREAASRSVAQALAQFVDQDDLQLLLLQAFDELERADFADRAQVSPSPIQRREPDVPEHQETRILTYAEFVAQKPQARSPHGAESSVAGTHVDSVRALLNRLTGGISEPTAPAIDAGDWMDLDDEDEESTLTIDIEEKAAEAKPPIDRVAFVKAVRSYETSMAPGPNAREIGGADVVKLRFWLLLILHSARWAQFDRGLPCNLEEFGWPRLIVRVLSSFFYGKEAPVIRLCLQGGYLDLPVDFLEAWITAIWVLDLISDILPKGKNYDSFRKPLPILRKTMIERMALTEAEFNGETAAQIRTGLNLSLGVRLRS